MSKNEKAKKITAENVVKVTATLVVVAGVGYASYLLGSQSGFNKAVDTVIKKFPYMNFIKGQMDYMSKLL